jgi:hypothetical protein
MLEAGLQIPNYRDHGVFSGIFSPFQGENRRPITPDNTETK